MPANSPLLATLVASCVLALALCQAASAFEFELASGTTRCFSEELTPNERLSGTIRLLPGHSRQLDIEVLNKLGHVVHSDVNVEAISSFSIQADEKGGDYKVCIHNRPPSGAAASLYGSPSLSRRLDVDIKIGVSAEDYEKIATKEHLKPIEVELRKMEDLVVEILHELQYQRDRESVMRDTNESTNARVSWMSFFTLIVLLSLGVWQSFYLKSFLAKKKII